MIRQVRCECGYIARGRTDDDVIVIILAHVRGIILISLRRKRLTMFVTGSNWCQIDPNVP
jgi:hypothetical protein